MNNTIKTKESQKEADWALTCGILTSSLVLISVLIPFLWVWIYWFFFIPFVGVIRGIKAIKNNEKKSRAKAICGILLCVLPFLSLIPLQIKEDDYIYTFEFDKMEDFQFYGTEHNDDGDEYLQLKHRLFVYSGSNTYVPHRDSCKKPDCEAFAVGENNALYTSLSLANDVTVKTRRGKSGLLEETRTKKCFVFGLYCPKKESFTKGEDAYDWTYHTTLYLPETIQVKIYPNTCTNTDKNKYGYINADKKECAMDENNYIFRNAYEYYK